MGEPIEVTVTVESHSASKRLSTGVDVSIDPPSVNLPNGVTYKGTVLI